MLNKKLFLIFLALCVGFLISLAFTFAYADVSPYHGRSEQIRLIGSSGQGPAHIPFDDLRFG